MPGPLAGIRIVELAGLGAAPFACMMLADHGADIVRVVRPGTGIDRRDPLLRNRSSIELDLKSRRGRDELVDLTMAADGLVEGFRPGVLERLDLGPETLLEANPRLVIGRMTGWGQYGPLSHLPGHDINYIAVSGVLGSIGRAGEMPVPPLNLVGDFGGGAMMLAFGMVSALLAVRNGAAGQVIDCAMTDGSALLMNMMWGFHATGEWEDARGVNLLDTGAPFYDTYQTADGGYVALGAIEPQFYAELRRVLGIADAELFDDQNDRARWPAQKRALEALLRTRTRAEWCAVFADAEACFAPVQSMTEARRHPHNVARTTFIEVADVVQAAPAPRYSGTPCDFPSPPECREISADWCQPASGVAE